MKRREYSNYTAYVSHQKIKTELASVKARIMATWNERTEEFRQWFKPVVALLPPGSEVLCLGARYGGEVAVFQQLGCKAAGIDLVPCPPLVVYGDFHKIPFGAASFDLVYCNALDHAYDLDKALREAVRVLRGSGYLLFHVALGAFGQYEALQIDSADEVISRLPDFDLVFNEPMQTTMGGLNRSLLFRQKETPCCVPGA